MSKTWLVTGAARGIGAEIVRAALAAGDQVVATGRNAARMAQAFPASERLLVLPLDVTDETAATTAIAGAEARFGGIDVLVNNAGYGQLGHFETHTPAEVEQQFATNVFGLLTVTRAALPGMRQRRRGHIFNLSSIAGIRGSLGGSLYCATKFAVEGFSESLSQEVAPFGIHVTLIEPGFFRTDFLDDSSVRFGSREIADYAEQSAAMRAAYAARNHAQAGDPGKLAAVMIDLARNPVPPLRLPAGSDAVEVVETKIRRLQSDLDAWRAVSLSTDGAY